jgi:hypothetical protein
MIKIIKVGKCSWKPIFICDYCSKPITEEGNVEFEVNQTNREPITGISYHLHKQCDYAFCFAHGSRVGWAWKDLSVFLRLLAQNTHVKPEAAKTWNELLGIHAEE